MLSPQKSLKSVRIDSKILQAIEQEAEDRGLSFNAHLASILKRYMEWNRVTDGGCITMFRSFFKLVMDELDDEKLRKIADENFRGHSRERLLAFSKSADLEGFLETVTIWSRNSGMFTCDIENNNGTFTILARHELGRNFSVLLMFAWERVLVTLLGLTPEFMVDHGSVFVRFYVPADNGSTE